MKSVAFTTIFLFFICQFINCSGTENISQFKNPVEIGSGSVIIKKNPAGEVFNYDLMINSKKIKGSISYNSSKHFYDYSNLIINDKQSSGQVIFEGIKGHFIFNSLKVNSVEINGTVDYDINNGYYNFKNFDISGKKIIGYINYDSKTNSFFFDSLKFHSNKINGCIKLIKEKNIYVFENFYFNGKQIAGNIDVKSKDGYKINIVTNTKFTNEEGDDFLLFYLLTALLTDFRNLSTNTIIQSDSGNCDTCTIIGIVAGGVVAAGCTGCIIYYATAGAQNCANSCGSAFGDACGNAISNSCSSSKVANNKNDFQKNNDFIGYNIHFRDNLPPHLRHYYAHKYNDVIKKKDDINLAIIIPLLLFFFYFILRSNTIRKRIVSLFKRNKV